jgi:hypothetical protein
VKNKSVKIVVTVPAADLKKLEAHVRPLGVDALEMVSHHILDVGNLIENLISDHEVLFCGYTFASRSAAQRAVTGRFKTCRSSRAYHFMDVSFMEGGKTRYERLYAPGSKREERRLARLATIYANATAKAAKARKAIEKAAGLPVAV